jgi:hypothetical protein
MSQSDDPRRPPADTAARDAAYRDFCRNRPGWPTVHNPREADAFRAGYDAAIARGAPAASGSGDGSALATAGGGGVPADGAAAKGGE